MAWAFPTEQKLLKYVIDKGYFSEASCLNCSVGVAHRAV